MGTVTNLRKGSSGSEVEKLQNALIEAGYDVGKTGADGVLGKNTEAAIRQYQKDNGLTVDGIAGKNTQGKLYGNNNANAGKTNTAKPKTSTGGGDKKPADVPKADPVDEAPAVVEKPNAYGNLTEEQLASYNSLLTQAFDTISQLQASRPGAYQYGADYDLANDYLSQYQNRDPFSYDFNSDALYNQYKDQYVQQGQMAMMDTMGQAAAMTGGYGSSYAQTVGQQAYNQYLGQLNEIMPELYDRAYNRYNQEGQEMLQMYDLYMGRENDNYNKYLDTVDMWNTQLAQANDAYTNLYNEFTDVVDMNYTQEQDAKKWEYQDEQDAKEEKNANWNKLASLISSGHTPTASELKAAGMTEAEANTLKASKPTTQYKDIDAGSTVYNTLTTEVKRVTSLEQLQGVVNRYLSLGYDPDQIDALTRDKYNELVPKVKEQGYAGGGGTGGQKDFSYIMAQ